MIHEMLHSMDTPNQNYLRLKGWDEGVLEPVMRMLRPQILAQRGVSIPEIDLQSRDHKHPYQKYIAALERVRSRLPSPHSEEEVFYYGLFGVPIEERQGLIEQWASQLPKSKQKEFRRVLLRAKSVLELNPK